MKHRIVHTLQKYAAWVELIFGAATQRLSKQIIVSFRSASGIRMSQAPFEAAAVHYVQLIER